MKFNIKNLREEQNVSIKYKIPVSLKVMKVLLYKLTSYPVAYALTCCRGDKASLTVTVCITIWVTYMLFVCYRSKPCGQDQHNT